MESAALGTGRLGGLFGCDHALFVYGTLQFPEVLQVLLGRIPSLEPTELTGWRAAALPSRIYPGLVAAPRRLTRGAVLSGLAPAEWAVLDAFEDDEYDLRRVRVGSGPVWTYVWTAAADPADWQRDRFAAEHLTQFAARSARWRIAPYSASAEGASE
ncbi:gamma-glutamylcyclotransferase [Nocardia sp. NBC_00508]|uniref:gamma-glutamylcyclotransferase family protein n=1 Tax=Nocardia sp. NBC_00508 TaxID=2975992 RepID=UPI002E8214E6|nr:gamma-glutamylcyclotransferase family protein [Nocardia sp. NBC_00508]WUD65227.1 gamma-glutamylcyclotransferase [Nocardia sp. NBC_00508]